MANNDYEIVKIKGEEVHLDPNNLSFNEATLTEYLQKEGGYYNNFGARLAVAEFLLQRTELKYEALYAEKFRDYKENEGGSDKLAEAKTESDSEVIEAKEKVLDARLAVRLLTQHLRAWDKNHENAQSLGHFLRKEMEKLGHDVIKDRMYSQFDKVDDLVTHVDVDDLAGK